VCGEILQKNCQKALRSDNKVAGQKLSKIEVCLRARPDQLYHLGFRNAIAHNTLARANQSRNWRIYSDWLKKVVEPVALF
jgi:hypothetical protein